MGMTEAVTATLGKAEKLKSVGAGNEANTKALLIDPVLMALGWDLGDVDVVAREVKVFDGTFLDYGLTPSAGPRLYVEAKGYPATSVTRSSSLRPSTTPTTMVSCGAS